MDELVKSAAYVGERFTWILTPMVYSQNIVNSEKKMWFVFHGLLHVQPTTSVHLTYKIALDDNKIKVINQFI